MGARHAAEIEGREIDVAVDEEVRGFEEKADRGEGGEGGKIDREPAGTRKQGEKRQQERCEDLDIEGPDHRIVEIARKRERRQREVSVDIRVERRRHPGGDQRSLQPCRIERRELEDSDGGERHEDQQRGDVSRIEPQRAAAEESGIGSGRAMRAQPVEGEREDEAADDEEQDDRRAGVEEDVERLEKIAAEHRIGGAARTVAAQDQHRAAMCPGHGQRRQPAQRLDLRQELARRGAGAAHARPRKSSQSSPGRSVSTRSCAIGAARPS